MVLTFVHESLSSPVRTPTIGGSSPASFFDFASFTDALILPSISVTDKGSGYVSPDPGAKMSTE